MTTTRQSSQLLVAKRYFQRNAARTTAFKPALLPWEGESQFAKSPADSTPTWTRFPSLKELVDPDRLAEHFRFAAKHKGQAVGADRIAFPDLAASEVFDVCRTVSRTILAGEWLPQPPRIGHVPKKDGTLRPIQIRSILDRVISSLVAQELWKLVNPRLPWFATNRPGGETWRALCICSRAVSDFGYTVFGQDDVYHAFDFVRIKNTLADFRKLIRDEKVVRFLSRILMGHDPHREPTGIVQGDAVSSPAMELRLHHLLDRSASVLRVPPLAIRHADNLGYWAASVPTVSDAIAEANQRLQRAGLRLKGQDGPPAELRETTAVFLGFELRVVRDQLSFRPGPHFLEKLRLRLTEASEAPDPRENARQKVYGWVQSMGPAWSEAACRSFTADLQRILSEQGFPQLLRSEGIREKMSTAYASWQRKLHEFRWPSSMRGLV